MEMKSRSYRGKVLPDGHLTLPEEIAKEIGKEFEVILLPSGSNEIYDFADKIARERGFANYTEDDIEKIIHESRGI